jgi:hypothetical protein
VNAPNPERDRRQRRVLVGLALLFFAPVGLSFYLYYGHSPLGRGGRVNTGDLIDPPRPVPGLALPLATAGATATGTTATGTTATGATATGATAPGNTASATTDPQFLRHKWTFLYVDAGACAQRCRKALYDTRQVRLALDRDMDRVQRVFLASGDCCDLRFLNEEHPDLITIRATGAASPLITLLPDVGGVSAMDAQRVYVIDPLGNLMMSYAPDAKPKGMLEDMKRLLRLSHIG